ncbi:hypothetical protein [Arthrobacter sp. SD76]|uniref:hypothetical protein n=1 Tax=Arthrobacter sp. SD76 TaxID=3415007 RepID=UPI003C754FF7
MGTGPLVNLIGYGGKPAGGDIEVALDAPWTLQASPAPVRLALYGRSDAAFDALAAVLAGRRRHPESCPPPSGMSLPEPAAPPERV